MDRALCVIQIPLRSSSIPLRVRSEPHRFHFGPHRPVTELHRAVRGCMSACSLWGLVILLAVVAVLPGEATEHIVHSLWCSLQTYCLPLSVGIVFALFILIAYNHHASRQCCGCVLHGLRRSGSILPAGWTKCESNSTCVCRVKGQSCSYSCIHCLNQDRIGIWLDAVTRVIRACLRPGRR